MLQRRMIYGMFTLLLVVTTLLGYAQTRLSDVTGLVNDDKGVPLSSVTVSLLQNEKTIQTTITDSMGVFSFHGLNPGIYSFSFSRVGFEPQTLTGYQFSSGKTSSVLINMVALENALNEVVVVGYGTQKKEHLTGAVASVKMDDVLRDRPLTSTSQALQGAVPGLQITYGSGQPGSGTSINIRGYTTLFGNTTPLVIVDNVPMDIDDVNPADIENVTVLKDASAAAIYGGRAAFGVIVITTKKGVRNQKPRFQYSNNLAVSRASTLPKKVSPLQLVSALNDFGTTNYWAGQDVKTWLEQLNAYQSNPSQFPDGFTTVNSVRYPLAQTDLYGALFEGGFEQLHNLSFSGGTEKTNYRTSLAYTNQDGIVTGKNDTYKRYNFNTYLSTALTRALTASVSVFYNNDLRNSPLNYGSIFRNVVYNGSYVPTGFGTLPGTNESLPYSSPDNLATMETPQEDKSNNLRLFGKLEFAPVKGFKITGEYTFTQNNNSIIEIRNANRYVDPTTFQLNITNPTSSYYKYTSATNVNALNLYASYNLAVSGGHNFAVVAGTNQEAYKQSGYFARREGIITSVVPSLSTSTGTATNDDDFNEYGLSGYFYRFNYAFKNRYLLELTGRYDGSSRFPEEDRFGFFPGASAGWVLTEEPWLQKVKNAFSQIKLRASYGEIGNQVTVFDGSAVPDYYPAIPGLTVGNANWIDPSTGIRYITLQSPRLVSSSFTWERISTYDAGIEFSTLRSRLSGTFDLYKEETKGMLVAGSSLPAVLGTAPPKQNRADLKVNGWDMSLTWKDRAGKDFSYSLGINLMGRQAPLITKYNNPNKLLSDFYEGQRVNEIWGYTTYGYYTPDNFVSGALDANQVNNRTIAANRGLLPGIAGFQGVFQNPGDIRFVDRNGDSVINAGANTVGDPGDRMIIGNSTRRLQYGINGSISYKNFDLSFFLQGIGNRDVWISNAVFWPYLEQFAGLFEHQLDYWTVTNTNAYYPRMYGNASGNTGTSRNVQTKYLSNGAYFRVKNIGAGYSLPQRWLQKIKLTQARLFFSGENLFTFDHLPEGLDPEASDLGSGGIYPFLKKFSFGINISF